MTSPAFLASSPIQYQKNHLTFSSFTCPNLSVITTHKVSSAQLRRKSVVQMCEEPVSAAERTRRALSETKPLVKFRRETEYLDQDVSFTYTKGVKEGGVDIWLITGILTFLVPLVGFAIGVATGNIDVNPR